MTPGPSANTFVDLLREPSDDLQAQIKKNLDVVWQTTAIHTIVSDVDFWTRTLYYDTTNHDKEPQEQLKTLTKIFHHLRTSTIECKDENDGSTDYWTDFFQKVSSHFQTVDVHAWVRQLYDQNGAIQCNNDNVSTGVVNGDCLRDKLVRMVERADTVGVERINGQALQAALPCESGQLKDKLLTTKPNQQARTMSIVDGYETLSSNAIKSKQGKPVERDRFIGNVNTDDTAQTEPAGNRGIVDNPAKGVAVWEKLVGTDRGVNGAVKDCATDVNSCDSEYDVGVTMKGGAIGGELVEDNGGPAEHESAERESVKGEPNGRVPTTNGVGGNSAVEDQPANDARILGDAVNDDIGSKSFGSERIVDAAAGVNEIPRAKTQTKEDGCLQSQITRMTLTKSRPLKGRLSDVDPIETNKLDLVGSTKACITNVFDSQSGPVKESNTKKYGKPNGIVESSADGSVDDGICAQSEPAEATLWQSKLIEMPTELNIEHNSVEPRPMEETGVCKALQLKSLCSSAQDRGSIQIELAEQGMAKKDPATMKPVGSDQREKLHLMSRTLPSIEKANVKPDPLATKQPAIFSRETSPMPHKQDTLSVQGMEAGNSAGSYIPLPSRIRQLMLFRWPGNEEYGQYVVVMFKIQFVVGTVLFGFLGMLLYFACCG